LIAELTLIVSSWLLGFQDSDAMSIDAAIGEMWLTHGHKAMGRKPLTPGPRSPSIGTPTFREIKRGT